MRVVEVAPKPASLIESMRDIGYSLSTALADLIDNCIAAEAGNIHVFASTDPSNMRVGVLDDGQGMSEEELLEAMRLGSRSPLEQRDRSDLGRFGLGLKTASFSQCRILTVVSRRNGRTAIARWNLDHIAESNKWHVEIPDDTASIPWKDRFDDTGTLVIWENLYLGSENEGAGGNEEEFVRQLSEARTHLELVFHRFLAGEPGCRKVRIQLNNSPLGPFDPFHLRHPATTPGPAERIRVSDAHVLVQPYTLPHQNKVTPAEWERYAGAEGYVRNQGFYVYREKRLIIRGTWFGLARQAELTKLARIRVDMPNSLDGVWRIDVKKASAQLPPVVRRRLRRIIDPMTTTSKRVYTTRGRKLVEENRIPVWSRLQNKNQITYRINEEHPIIIDLKERLSEEARGDLQRIIDIAGASLPMDALFADLGGDEASIIGTPVTDDSLKYAVLTTYSRLLTVVGNRERALDIMRAADPFRPNWERTLQIVNDTYGEEDSND